MMFTAKPGNRTSMPRTYSTAAIALHWLLAAFLTYQFTLGTRLEHASPSEKFAAFQMHKSVGITILVLSLLRLAVRLSVRRPAPYDRGLKGTAANLVHILFYVVMIGGPLTGWAIVSASKIKVPTVIFGLFPWPHLPLGTAMAERSETAHVVLVFLLPVLIALHVAGVLYHLSRRDEVPQRMMPLSAPALGVVAGLALLATAGVLGRFGPVPQLWDARAMLAVNAPPPETALAIPGTDATASLAPLVDASAMAPDSPGASETASASPEAEDAQAVTWVVEPGSRIGFATSYTGADITGQFRRFSAQIRFGADDLANSRIDATIDLRSVETADETRDTTLKGEDFFDVGKFSTATLTARKFARVGPDRYTASGTLGLHGVTRPITLSFGLRETGDKAVARGTATLDRLAFGVGSGDWASTDAIPAKVAVTFTIAARKAN